MRGSRPGVGAAVASVAVLLLVGSTAGCLGGGDGDGDDTDYGEWFMALTVDKFNSNGQRAVNVTYLLFEVRYGPMLRDDWRVQESDGFTKGNDSVFPLRVEARYDDGRNEVEDFPIMGSKPFLTGSVFFRDKRLKVNLDGDRSLYTIDRSIDLLPHGHEVTATIEGDYGTLVLYFNMNEPAT
jgi:hypothetical protein